MTPFNKIINSIKNNRQDITSTDIASLTDNEIDEINKCYTKKHNKNQDFKFDILYYIDSKKDRIGINHVFMLDYVKIDEYIYISDFIYVKKMNKFQKWLKNDTV